MPRLTRLPAASPPPCVGCVDLPPHGVNLERAAVRAVKRILGTATLRRLWAPACKPKDTEFLAAFSALDACMRAAGYAPRARDTGAYNCRRITAGDGWSLHSYGPAARFKFWSGVEIATALAVDVNWTDNPYGRRLVTDMPAGMIAAIKAVRTRSGKQVWGWGGDYRTVKDAMHLEIVCSPADLATGINPATVPGGRPIAKPPANAGRRWVGFRAPATDAGIYGAGGLDNQVSQLQILLGFTGRQVDGRYQSGGPTEQRWMAWQAGQHRRFPLDPRWTPANRNSAVPAEKIEALRRSAR